jgi:RHS repeat-associated protein
LTQGSATFEPTPHGDLLRKTDGANSSELTYDELGNLLEAKVTSGATTKTIDYVVDGFGRRVARKVNGVFDRSWLYRDELRPVSEVDSAGTFTHFVYADTQSAAPDFMIRSGVLLRVVKDYLGNVRAIANAQTGAVLQAIEYDAFGVILRDSNPGFQPFGFAGGLYDTVTGLVRFGARDYDASIGRWTSKDVVGFAGGDTNLYTYAGNEPVNTIDPDGEHPVVLAVVAGLGVLLATSDEEAAQAAIGAVVGAFIGPALGYCAKVLRPATIGTLSSAERVALQRVANEFDTEIHVVGSRAAGKGRGVGTDLPPGKGPGTRSDIDLRIDSEIDIRTSGMFSDALKDIGPPGLVDVRPIIGPPRSPVITFTPIRGSIWFSE